MSLYGKTVFAVAGRADSSLSEAPHFFIQNGAKLPSSADDIDILEGLGECTAQKEEFLI